MIAIQKISQDSGSAVVIKGDVDSDLFDATARTNRTATLDGGAIVEHYGYTASDLTLNISARITESVETQLKTLFENETFLLFMTKFGAYYGVISSLRAQGGKINLTFLVKE